MQSQETARSLYRRCQNGNSEALRALLLSAADGLYSAALAASADEAHAEELAVQTWEAFLGGLGRGKAKETAELRLQRALGVEIAGELDAATAERAVRLWAESDGTSVFPAPAQLVSHLAKMNETMAPAVARRARSRRAWIWTGRLAIAAGVALFLILGVQLFESLVTGRAREVQFAALRQRAQEERLTWAVRDALMDVPDPQGADRYRAALLAQVELLLEDLVAGPSLGATDDLRNLQQRMAQDDLLWRLREAAQEAPEAERSPLTRVTLLFEEAQSL